MQRDLRRNENILSVSGVTVILFGVWTAIKLVLYFSLSEDGFRAIPRGAEGQPERLMLTAILVLFIAISMSSRLCVGLSARAESMGKKKGCGYIVLAMLIVTANLLALGFTLADIEGNFDSWMDLIITLFVEATSMLTVVELITAAFRVRKLKRLAAEEQEGEGQAA